MKNIPWKEKHIKGISKKWYNQKNHYIFTAKNTKCINIRINNWKKEEFTTRCIYPFNRIVINPYGYVVACTADFHNQLSIGDTRKESLQDIWKGRVFNYFRKKHLKDEYSGLYCNKCINNVECKTTKLIQAFEQKL